MKTAKRILAIFTVLVLVIVSCCGFINGDIDIDVGEMSTGYGISDIAPDNGMILGTAVMSGEDLNMKYTADGIEFKAIFGGNLTAIIRCEAYNDWSLRVKAVIDGVAYETSMKTNNSKEYTLATGIKNGVHTVRILRETEYSIGKMYMSRVFFTGEILPYESKLDKSIEFFGDSITAGYGTTSFTNDPDWPNYEDGTATYAYKTAEAINANYRIFAYSGIGVGVGGNSDGGGNTMLDNIKTFQLDKNADFVVINLGTNDSWKYTLLGMNEEQITGKFAEFIKYVRETHPKAKIIFARGIMTDGANTIIDNAVNSVKSDGEEHIYVCNLSKGTSGGAGHPDASQQAVCGEELTSFIKNLMKTVAGDVNSDKAVDLKDAVSIVRNSLGFETAINNECSDANGDGKVDYKDAQLIAQYVAKWRNVVMKGGVYADYNTVSAKIGELTDLIKLDGRYTIVDNNLNLDWAYSGFEIYGQLKGNVSITAQQTKDLLLYGVIDDDYDNPVQVVTSGNGEYKIAENLEAGYHSVKFIKATEPSGGALTITGLTYNGSLTEKPQDKKLTIEYIGDSVTSAAGLYTDEQQPNAILRQNTLVGYAALTSRALNADTRIFSQSGAAAVSAERPRAGEFYKRVLFNETAQYTFPAQDEPDIIVINLGTNDTPFFLDDHDALATGIKNLLSQVRSENPNAKIVFCYGIMATNIEDVYKTAVNGFAATDKNTYYCHLERIDCTGSGGHPTPAGHAANSLILTQYLASLINK